MEVVLLKDVKALGKKDAVVTVSDGYARNFLFPKKLAMEATKANLNVVKQQQAAALRLAAEQLAQAKEQAKAMEVVCVRIPVKVGANGKLFGAVSSKEIADALKSQWGYDIDKKKIQLEEPIKAVGEQSVTVRLHKDVTAAIKVAVEEAQ